MGLNPTMIIGTQLKAGTQLIAPNRRPSLRDLLRQSKPVATFANLRESWPVCNFRLDLAGPEFKPRNSSSKKKL